MSFIYIGTGFVLFFLSKEHEKKIFIVYTLLVGYILAQLIFLCISQPVNLMFSGINSDTMRTMSRYLSILINVVFIIYIYNKLKKILNGSYNTIKRKVLHLLLIIFAFLFSFLPWFIMYNNIKSF